MQIAVFAHLSEARGDAVTEDAADGVTGRLPTLFAATLVPPMLAADRRSLPIESWHMSEDLS